MVEGHWGTQKGWVEMFCIKIFESYDFQNIISNLKQTSNEECECLMCPVLHGLHIIYSMLQTTFCTYCAVNVSDWCESTSV